LINLAIELDDFGVILLQNQRRKKSVIIKIPVLHGVMSNSPSPTQHWKTYWWMKKNFC